jgi:hypothetical protein
MYRVTCNQCGASGIAEDGTRLQQAVSCHCCTEPHDHQHRADTCPGNGHNHEGLACPEPEGGVLCLAVTEDGEECPGGHCHVSHAECQVCRPITAEWLGIVPMNAAGVLGPSLLASALQAMLAFSPLLRVWMWVLALANMTDRNVSGANLVNKIMQALFTSSTSFTITPGTGGGSAFTVTPPFKLRLMTAQGSNTANGTELSATGYTAGGATMGATAFGAPSAGVATNSNAISWTAGAAWTAVVAIEVWDTAGTPLRYLQGSITSITLGNGNTLTFAAASISADASQW